MIKNSGLKRAEAGDGFGDKPVRACIQHVLSCVGITAGAQDHLDRLAGSGGCFQQFQTRSVGQAHIDD